VRLRIASYSAINRSIAGAALLAAGPGARPRPPLLGHRRAPAAPRRNRRRRCSPTTWCSTSAAARCSATAAPAPRSPAPLLADLVLDLGHRYCRPHVPEQRTGASGAHRWARPVREHEVQVVRHRP